MCVCVWVYVGDNSDRKGQEKMLNSLVLVSTSDVIL